jgi:hypothetical protein
MVVLESKLEKVIPARSTPSEVPDVLALDFTKSIKAVHDIPDRKKEGPRSPEEIFMLRHLAPATNSFLIKNEYTLQVKVTFNSGWTCCSAIPNVKVPMTLIPVADPNVYGFPEPPGFSPTNLGFTKFEIP